MKLNHDCVRDVLLAVEAAPFENTYPEQLQSMLPQYSEDELVYTCLKLDEAGYLNAQFDQYLGGHLVLCWIESMTFNGHEFLDTIRDDTNWGKVKDTAKKAGVFSMKALGQIAQGVAQAAITSALQSL
ncbi:DUF2513 domain-containing protein [Dysosmobacter sp.]|uniref:DUF2513 domain-containing protein n=1 Tax=Dysosmobacter sp. TaxID=2591382 RepID=UPI002604C46C|nr:DUF2513 domain-containing protein [Dysosmobacter sp.]